MEGACEVGQGVDWQIFSDRGGWDGSPLLEGKVDRGEVAGKVPG